MERVIFGFCQSPLGYLSEWKQQMGKCIEVFIIIICVLQIHQPLWHIHSSTDHQTKVWEESFTSKHIFKKGWLPHASFSKWVFRFLLHFKSNFFGRSQPICSLWKLILSCRNRTLKTRVATRLYIKIKQKWGLKFALLSNMISVLIYEANISIFIGLFETENLNIGPKTTVL